MIPAGFPTVLTLKEACGVLRLSDNTVRGLLTTGALPGRKIGLQWRIRSDDLNDFLKGAPCPSIDAARLGTSISGKRASGTGGRPGSAGRRMPSGSLKPTDATLPWAHLLGRPQA